MKNSALRRFLKYVTYDTRSDEHSLTFPSTPGQLVLLRELLSELEALGLADAAMDDFGYVMATIPATPGCERAPVIGSITVTCSTAISDAGDERCAAAERGNTSRNAAPTIRERVVI